MRGSNSIMKRYYQSAIEDLDHHLGSKEGVVKVEYLTGMRLRKVGWIVV